MHKLIIVIPRARIRDNSLEYGGVGYALVRGERGELYMRNYIRRGLSVGSLLGG